MATLHHEYLGNHPMNRETGWSNELNGVTHDSRYWYFTKNESPRLLRIPVTYDLNKTIRTDTYDPVSKTSRPVDLRDLPAGVSFVTIEDQLSRLGYNHFGDLDYWQGYLFVALEGAEPAVAVYKAPGLQFIGRIMMTQSKGKCAWCAIRSVPPMGSSQIGILVTMGAFFESDGDIDRLQRYQIDLSAIRAGRLSARALPVIYLRDKDNATLLLKYTQGGAFAPDGDLYLVNGYYTWGQENCGIHRFSVTGNIASASSITAIETHRSTNGSGDFNFEYHTGRAEEPEGITYWDLEDGRAPGIRGHLHVLMINNDWWNPDDLYFKHYRVTRKTPAPPHGHNGADQDNGIHEPTPPPGGEPY